MEKQEFKVGDWIIATQPLYLGGNSIWGGSNMERSFLESPIQVVAITEKHIVYHDPRFQERDYILAKCEMDSRVFIIADPVLVNIVKSTVEETLNK